MPPDGRANDRKADPVHGLGLPGVGKSRLARELANELDRWLAGATLPAGACPYGEGITYWPLGEVIRDLAGITPELTGARGAGAAGRGLSGPGHGRSAGLRHRSAGRMPRSAEKRSIARSPTPSGAWWSRPSAERPILLVVEDIHWAEPPLLDLLEYLATWTGIDRS